MNNQIGLKEAWEQLLAYDPAVWIGVFTAIVVLLLKSFYTKKESFFRAARKK